MCIGLPGVKQMQMNSLFVVVCQQTNTYSPVNERINTIVVPNHCQQKDRQTDSQREREGEIDLKVRE